MLLKELIRQAVQTLSGLYPERESRQIVYACLEDLADIRRHTEVLEPDFVLSEEKTSAMLSAIERMASGEPLQYVTGKAYFYGREFNVSPDVLIPRQETEILCHEILSKTSVRSGKRILDLCTGSGCIAWTLALEVPGDSVSAVDVSAGALTVACSQDFSSEMSRTGALSPQFIKADILKPHSESGHDFLCGGKYDVITSNPPYVMDREKPLMHANVLEHEPHLALFVPDEDPLKFYRAVAQWSVQLLASTGIGMAEINEALGEQTAEVFREAGFREVRVVKDLHEKDRFVLYGW